MRSKAINVSCQARAISEKHDAFSLLAALLVKLQMGYCRSELLRRVSYQ